MDKICAYPACGKRSDGICTGCRLSRYCSKEHQVLHWEEHRLSCKLDQENLDTHARKPLDAITNYKPGKVASTMLNKFIFLYLYSVQNCKPPIYLYQDWWLRYLVC